MFRRWFPCVVSGVVSGVVLPEIPQSDHPSAGCMALAALSGSRRALLADGAVSLLAELELRNRKPPFAAYAALDRMRGIEQAILEPVGIDIEIMAIDDCVEALAGPFQLVLDLAKAFLI